MLQKINEKIQGLVAWIIVSLVILTFAMFGVDYYMQSKRDGANVAEVNGSPISKHEFDLQFRRLTQFKDTLHWSAMRENQLKAQVLNDLILNSLSVQTAKLNGFAVTPNQANGAIYSIPQFQMDGHFNSMKYAQALNGAFFTPESFQREVQQGMLLNQQRFAFIGTAFALPNEIEQFVKLYMQTRDYSYTRIPALKFVDQADVKQTEVESYYNKHQEVFLTPERLSVKYIQLSLPELKNKIQLSRQEIEQYYNDHQTQFMLPAQWDLDNIVIGFPEKASQEEQAKALKFAQKLSKRFNKHPQAFAEFVEKVKKGEFVENGLTLSSAHLPTIYAGQTNLDADLVDINKADMVSLPVRTPRGYELFKCLSYQPSHFKALKEVDKQIAELLINEKAQTLFNQMMDKLSELSFQHPDSLDSIAKKLKLDIQETPIFSKRGGSDAFTQNKSVLRAAFSPDVLKYGNNSEPLQLDHDHVVVLRLGQHVPASKQALVDVKLLIAKKLAKKQAQAEARKLGEMLVAYRKFPDGQKNPMSVASNLAWKKVEHAARDAADVPAGVNELAFSLPSVGTRSGRTLVGGDFVVVELNQINPGNISLLDPEQISSITQQIESNFGMMDYDLYIQHMMSQAQIKKQA
jgi:peptidyl-prolyl cis-trans isomerase D